MRLRLTFSKTGSLRYAGHLDLHTIWERTVRRAGLPLLYTQGFHPGPRIQVACALPLGFSGRGEIVDIWLEDSPAGSPMPAYIELLQPAAPPGLTVLSAEQVDEHSPALQTQVVSADYKVSLLDPLSDSEQSALSEKVSVLLGAASIPAERRGKSYDLRPLIEDLMLMEATGEVPGEAQNPKLLMRLAAREGATGRPEAVLQALGVSLESTSIERTRIIFKADG